MLAPLVAIALAAVPVGGQDAVACRATPTSWSAVAERMPGAVRPARTPGLRLTRLVVPDPRCQSAALDAVYRGQGGAYLRIVQGPEQCCGGGGESAPVARPAVSGWAATLYRYGEGPHRAEGGWTVYLRRPGVEVAVLSSRVPRPVVLRVARSLRAATPAPGADYATA